MHKRTLAESAGRFYSNFVDRNRMRERCVRAGYADIPYTAIGRSIFLTFVISLAVYFLIIYRTGLLSYDWVFVAVTSLVFYAVIEGITLLVFLVGLQLFLSVKAYERTQRIEDSLPLFLREFSTNLKAGREFVDALEDSLNPQLGPLYEDMRAVSTRIRSGIMTEMVLKQYSERYDSYAINETFEIILDAYRGGGSTAEIIERIAENLEVIHYLKRNAVASVSNYIIFTSIVALIVAPFLFALSYNLLWLIKNLLDRLVLTNAGPTYMSLNRSLDINFGDFTLFAKTGLGIIAGSAASIIAIIRKGSIKSAPGTIIIFVAVAVVVYIIANTLLSNLFMALFSL